MPSSKLFNSMIYEGQVSHSRYQPAKNSFTYKTFMFYLDLDELEEIFALSRFYSLEKPNLVSLFRKDFFGDSDIGLKKAIHTYIENQTGELIDGKVFLLSNLRYLGHIANPITCYYCFDSDQVLRYVVAEVTNTPWGETQPYIIPCDANKPLTRHIFQKEMYVSPFMPMSVSYHWQHSIPGDALNLSIACLNKQQRLLAAHLTLTATTLTASAMRRIAFVRSLMTVKVTLATYWQALKLFSKGVPLVKKVSNPSSQTSRKKPDEVQRTTHS